jgi:hypothetical protein
MRPEERIQEREAYARGFAVHVGVDAGKQFHKLVACGPDRVRTKAFRVDVHRAGFLAAIEFLTATFPTVTPAETLVAIEFGGHLWLPSRSSSAPAASRSSRCRRW